MELAGFLRNRA